MTFTKDEKRLEAMREHHMRCRVYPRLVAQGKMKQAEADRKTAIMRAISEDYRGPDLLDKL